ncbi:MAG TPA: hypothetical protein VKR06_38480 [Ktedonosporobacter sp.]|nr:hypothetical protein [Ktedonosporobacter sp.]
MEEKNAPVKDKIDPDLLVPPHMVGELIRLVTGEWRPDDAQQEQLIAHLIECQDCRIMLISLLSAEQEQLVDPSEGSLQDILAQFVAIHHKIAGLGYEQMGAYAEAIVDQGQDEADKRFPLLVEHLRTCPTCKVFLEDILLFLRETDEIQ